MNHPDAIVIGGGIIGLASARQLALRGLRVTLHDAGIPGREASWASGGMLAATFEGHAKPLRSLAQASQNLYADWIQQIEEESGIPIEFQKNGTLVIARSAEEMDNLEASTESWERPSPPIRLSPEEILSKEPQVNKDVTGGYFLPEDWSVNSRTLIQSLTRSLKHLGVKILPNCPVKAVHLTSSDQLNVTSSQGTESCQFVVHASGAWAGKVAFSITLSNKLPVRPIRGQMIKLTLGQYKLRHVLRWAGGYLVPRDNGAMVLGSTQEDVGFDKNTTASGLEALRKEGASVIPSIAREKALATWAGLRPGTPDNLPILGSLPGNPQEIFATGHFRNGILLAPITAHVVGDLVERGETGYDLSHFQPSRFLEGTKKEARAQ